jgi:hypothetical protein
LEEEAWRMWMEDVDGGKEEEGIGAFVVVSYLLVF